MPRIASTRPTLRLVDGGPSAAATSLPADHERMGNRIRAVEAENRAASELSIEDARLIFAEEVGEQLQGGTVALLTPERRKRLISRAEGLGLRPFDANLIIAIMQDRARGGEFDADARGDARLGLIRPADEMTSQTGPRAAWIRWLAVGALTAGLFVLLVLWIVG